MSGGRGGTRDTCLDCVRKHLSQAAVLCSEAHQGYPQHRWLAVGHMAEASEECVCKHPGLADEIRRHRLELMKNPDHPVPFMDLIKRASELAGDWQLSGLSDEVPSWVPAAAAVAIVVWLWSR